MRINRKYIKRNVLIREMLSVVSIENKNREKLFKMVCVCAKEAYRCEATTFSGPKRVRGRQENFSWSKLVDLV